MEAQGRNAPLGDNVGTYLAVGIRIGKHFAPPGEPDMSAVGLPCALLQFHTVAFFVVAKTVEHADAGHLAPAAKFDVIPAGKIILTVKFPPRHVHMHAAHAVVVVWRHLFDLWEVARTNTARRVREIPADSSGRVSDSGVQSSRSGVQGQG